MLTAILGVVSSLCEVCQDRLNFVEQTVCVQSENRNISKQMMNNSVKEKDNERVSE